MIRCGLIERHSNGVLGVIDGLSVFIVVNSDGGCTYDFSVHTLL